MDDRQKTLDEFFRNNNSSKKKKEKDSKEIDDYFNHVSKKKPKRTFSDKVVEFFRIISFKNKFDESKVSTNKKRAEITKNSVFTKKWYNIQDFFIKRFSFEAGVDILDDKSVLYRKNLVIRNIIIITNIVFLLFTLIGSEGLNQKINLIVTFIIGLIMFISGRSIRNIVKEEPTTLHKQQMGEYLSGIYVLMMAIAVYIKLRLTLGESLEGGFFSITQAGYSLIYFALVVIALYQDPKLLNVVFKVTIVAMTIIHVVVMYPIYNYANNFTELWNYIEGPILTDIILRTLVLAVFMIGLYSTVKISEDINIKRKQELVKRRNMEKDFKDVVSDVFDVIAVYKQRGEDLAERHYARSAKRVAKLAGDLGGFLGYSSKLSQEIFEFSTIHIDKRDILNIDDYDSKEQLNEKDYKIIREKTIIGSIIIKRLQLDKKGEDIVRAHFEKTVNKDFIKEMNGIQNNRESQVILLSHIYDILRQERNYKKKLNHGRAIDLIRLEFNEYFDPQIIDRFIRYESEFESIYYDLLEE
ncbi:MAG: hypothetical protein PF513_07075 [Tenericutes bacterium]|jgi:response regulator RpfG family c-di-GMP phosphodiesterase|nr:hypothetical protein [Mycoplasmatota bacterium]